MGHTDAIKSFCKTRLGYDFKKFTLIQQALTHASGAGGARDYETFEFLGDRVLSLVMSHWLLQNFPGSSEGDLARRHTALVRKNALCEVAHTIHLGAQIRLSKGEKSRGTHQQQTILADVMEAVIGALFMDAGYDACAEIVLRLWQPLFENLGESIPKDAKTQLQEWSQGAGNPLPTYTLDKIYGPSHAPEVWVAVSIPGMATVTVSDVNRKQAEQKGAALLYAQLTGKECQEKIVT